MKGTELIKIEETELTAKTLLGCDGGSLIKLMPDGAVKSVFKKVRLYENQKHFYWQPNPMDKVNGGQWLITLEGYKELVKFTDLKVLKIDHMITNGRKVDNPFYETDSTGKLIRIVEEITVYGRTPQGDIAFSRARVIADINAMLSKKLLKAAEYDQELGEFCDYEQYQEMRKKKAVFFFPVTEQSIMGQTIIMGFAINMNNKKAFELIRKHMDEIEHEYKKVGAKAYRNAVKSHPAIGKYVVSPQGDRNRYVEISIIQWTTDFTAEELKMIEEYKSTGITAPPEINIQSDDDTDITELEPEEFETLEEVTEQEQPSDEPDDVVEDENAKLVSYIQEAQSVLENEEYEAILKKYNVTELAEAQPMILKMIKKDIDSKVDENLGGQHED